MKRRMISALLAGALCTGTAIVPAGAVHVTDIAGLGVMAAVSAVSSALESDDVHAAPPVQDGASIGFRGLEETVRANNQTIQAFKKTLAGIANTNLDAQFWAQEMQYQVQLNEYSKQVNAYETYIKSLEVLKDGGDSNATIDAQITMAESLLKVAQAGAAQISAIIDGLDDAQEDAENELDDTYASTEKQLENAANQIVVGAQTAYLGVITIREGIETLDRNLAALDRNIQVVEKQVEIGMASELTLENLKQARRTAAAQRETLVLQQTTTENQLSLLCGNTADTTVHPTTAPTVTEQQLAEMNYEKDLDEALDNSYSIWSARDEMRQASNDYEDDVTSTVDAYEAAKLNLEYAEENVTNSFRQLYLDVQDKKRLLDEAQAAYENEQRNFAVDELQYERGMISKIDYLTAQDDLAAQEDAVRTAEHDLFSAYNTYDWAKRGYMAGA
nr:TolC family protein [uncultured Agathobaculum sp.]